MIFGRVINKYYRKYWYLLILGVLALLLVDYAQLCLPKILGDLIDHMNNYGTIDDQGLTKVVLSIFLIGVAIFVGRIIWRVTILRAGFLVEADLRKEMFLHAEKLSTQYYQEKKVGALMAIFTNDLETVQEVVASGTIFMVDAIFLGGLALIKMIILNWKLGLIACIPLILLVACGGIIGKAMNKKQKEKQEAYEQMSDFSQENFTGLAVIKAFVKEVQELREFAKINNKNQKANIEVARLSVLLDIVINVLVYSIIVLIFIIGGYFVFNPDFNFTAGNVTEFVGYFNTIIWPMLAIAQIINLRSRGNTSLKRISALLDEKVEIKDNEVIELQDVKGNIEFRNLSFIYPNSSKVSLKNISLKINQGEIIGIVGKIGSGKTTFVNMLLHLYNLQEGKLFIDGIDIMNISIKELRENVGYVPQDHFLFSDTIANNIAFAKKDATIDEIKEACDLADIKENIEEFDMQYETFVGERGATLSGGQKQRVSLARAILKNSPILILDDVVSAVDIKTEEKILSNLEKVRKGKTTLIVASRVSTVKKASRIIVFNNGEIEAFDNHENLLKISPTYHKMVELQELEKEVEGYHE